MADFRFVISDPKTRKAAQVSKNSKECEALFGKKIGETFSGDIIGLNGYELQITGGSDKDGFPMRKDVQGAAKKKILITKSTGFRAKLKKKGEGGKTHLVDMRNGVRKKKTVRGNTISEDTAQVNCKVVKEGPQGFEATFPPKAAEAQQA